MNDAACTVFVNLINLAVRMMPIFVCLEPKHRDRENIDSQRGENRGRGKPPQPYPFICGSS